MRPARPHNSAGLSWQQTTPDSAGGGLQQRKLFCVFFSPLLQLRRCIPGTDEGAARVRQTRGNAKGQSTFSSGPDSQEKTPPLLKIGPARVHYRAAGL